MIFAKPQNKLASSGQAYGQVSSIFLIPGTLTRDPPNPASFWALFGDALSRGSMWEKREAHLANSAASCQEVEDCREGLTGKGKDYRGCQSVTRPRPRESGGSEYPSSLN